MGSAGLEFIEEVPLLGGARYGGHLLGAMGQLGADIGGAVPPLLKGDLNFARTAELMGKAFGVPGTAQMKKTIKYFGED